MSTPPEKPTLPKPSGEFSPSTEELRDLAGTDHILKFMMDNGLPLGRDTYIAINWGEEPEPWTHEHEDELPEFMQRNDAVEEPDSD
jgi:hypothetical protein